MNKNIFGDPVWETDDTIWLEQGSVSTDVGPAPATIPQVVLRIGRFVLVRFIPRPEPMRRPFGFRPSQRRP